MGSLLLLSYFFGENMKICPRCVALAILFLLGAGLLASGYYAKVSFSARDLLTHCIAINKGEILPYPSGCVKPLQVEDGVFSFVNTKGDIEEYVIVEKRDGTYLYYEITK